MEKVMKKLLTALVLSFALVGTVSAQHRHHGHHGYYGPRVIHHHGGNWGQVFVPLIIGGVVGAAIANNNKPVETPTVVVQSPIVQGSPIIQCPQGTYPFENFGWVKNQYGQFVQTTYIECK
jgi:hypothetical protein